MIHLIYFLKGIQNVNKAGEQILSIIYVIAYWVVICKGTMDIITNLKQRDMKALMETITFYVIVYAAMFFLPWIMKMIEGIFR